MTSRQIRQQFLDFFAGKDHAIVPSASLVPADDPTLMFTNAGMNQFKDVFLGTGSRPYTRVADTQKCIRAGGKHNDLDDVGQDTYHHTLFEMLGNWSFGDYFKKEAIEWAWELLTGVWGIEKDRLYATYFEGDKSEGLEPDDEAARLWKEMTDIDPSHVLPGDKKDNFWEMGDTGPCGPCSEIHIDLTPDKTGAPLVNAGDHRVIEIWNLVFIQFNRDATGKLADLPAKHVDTGMGFERTCAVLQGMEQGKLGQVSNYDTDVFTPIFAAIQKRTGASEYRGTLPNEPRDSSRADAHLAEPTRAGEGPRGLKSAAREGVTHDQVMLDVSYRVIADHLRCLTFALTDGAVPSNEGRGYVLRRILRRAVRYGRQYMDMHGPFLCDLVQPLVDHMADAFPELRSAHNGENVRHVVEILRDEEESFLKTIDRGIKLFIDAAARAFLLAVSRQSEFQVSVTRFGGPDFLLVPAELWWTDASFGEDTEVEVFGSDRTFGDKVKLKPVRDLSQADFDALGIGSPTIATEDAFRLHDTYGFPIDLTQLMAEEHGLRVDLDGYERLMEEARDRARASRFFAFSDDAPPVRDELDIVVIPVSEDALKYKVLSCTGAILGTFDSRGLVHDVQMNKGDTLGLVVDRTCFYAEAGGQVGDRGAIHSDTGEFEVHDTQKVRDAVIHIGCVTRGHFEPKQAVRLNVETSRRPTMQNHTSTHILNWALREVLGEGVQQKGSLVDPEKTRFDFSHNKPVTPEELERVEVLVNQQIEAQLTVFTQEVDQAKARRINTLRAVFGEQYPERVRVVSIGAPIGDEQNPAPDTLLGSPDDPKWMKHPVEFCGGTHLGNSGDAERFVLISEEGVAKGVRRVVGLSGEAAREAEAKGAELLAKTDALITTASRNRKEVGTQPSRDREGADLNAELASLQRTINEAVIPVVVRHKLGDKLAELRRMAKKQAKQRSAESGRSAMEQVAALLESAETVNGVAIVVGQIDDAPAEALRGAIDWVRNKTQASAVLLASVSGVKVTLVAGMSTDVVDRGVKAGDVVRQIAPIVGGSGGGKPTLAQAGGKNPDAVPEALEKAKALLRERLR